MNEYISEETPYNNIPHDDTLAIEICKGLRPNIFKYTPIFLADLIFKCWDAKEEDRPTAKELHEELEKFHRDDFDEDSDDIESIESQIYEYDVKIKLNRTKPVNSDAIQPTLNFDKINQEQHKIE
ncbi:unnamed protein product [Rhizophagus irregularis]|nr:unnamed protein product [Rhizophagus irregularis]